MTPIRKALCLTLSALLAVLVLAGAAAADPVKEKKAKLAAVQAQLAGVHEQSEIAVERYNAAAARLKDVRARVKRNAKLLKVAEYKLDLANEHLTSRARQTYKADEAGILDVVFSSRSFEDLLTQLDVMRRMAESDARAARTARTFRREVADRRRALDEDRKAAVDLVAQREKSKDEVLALQARLEGAAGGLQDEIAELEAAAARRAEEAAERAQAEQQDRSPSPRGSSGGSASSPQSGGGTSGGSVVVDPGGSGHSAVVGIAQRYLGVPYVYGGASPRGFDCSGLAMYCYAQVGIGLAHGATAQQRASRPVPLSALQPGDLVFFGSASYSHHVGIYVGGGSMIHAPHTGAVVSYGSISGAWIGGRF